MKLASLLHKTQRSVHTDALYNWWKVFLLARKTAAYCVKHTSLNASKDLYLCIFINCIVNTLHCDYFYHKNLFHDGNTFDKVIWLNGFSSDFRFKNVPFRKFSQLIKQFWLWDSNRVELIQRQFITCYSFQQSESQPAWPDWAIYWTLGNFLKPLSTINLHKSPTFLGNFCKGVQNLSFF